MWWRHSNPICCNECCLNFLHSLVVETLKYLLIFNHVLVLRGGRGTPLDLWRVVGKGSESFARWLVCRGLRVWVGMRALVSARVQVGTKAQVSIRVPFTPACAFCANVWEPMNGILSFYKCMLNDGDTKRCMGHSNPTCCNQNCPVTGSGDAKILLLHWEDRGWWVCYFWEWGHVCLLTSIYAARV